MLKRFGFEIFLGRGFSDPGLMPWRKRLEWSWRRTGGTSWQKCGWSLQMNYEPGLIGLRLIPRDEFHELATFCFAHKAAEGR
jgi:hypothetical protein